MANPSPTAQAHLIKAGRLRLGLTQQELAQRLGVHPQTVASFESGRKLATGSEVIGKMAELFGYDADEFYIAAQRLPPDMHDYIRHQPKLMVKIRELMNHQQAG